MGFFDSVASVAKSAVKVVANPVAAVATQLPPIKSYGFDGGDVTIWAAAFEIHLNRQTVDRLAAESDLVAAVATMVGLIVAGSGGTLAPAAPFIAAFIGLEWAAIMHEANHNGVRLQGSYVPPSPILVPHPA